MVSIGGKYEQIEIPIKECKEYEEPVYEPSVPETPDPIPAPMALMSRSEMETPIKAGETRTITIYVKNVGTIRGALPKVVVNNYKYLASRLLFDITLYTLFKGV
jgi:hypothetical protein